MTENATAETLNLTPQLGRLLFFISDVATAIRMHTPYNGRYDAANPVHALDVLYLADSIHNFSMLGRALAGGSVLDIQFSCDLLVRQFARYRQDNQVSVKGDPKATFERNGDLANLDQGLLILNEIRSAIQQYLPEDARRDK